MVLLLAFDEQSEMLAEHPKGDDLAAHLDLHVALALVALGGLGHLKLDDAGAPVALERFEIDHPLALRRPAHVVGDAGEADLGELAQHGFLLQREPFCRGLHGCRLDVLDVHLKLGDARANRWDLHHLECVATCPLRLDSKAGGQVRRSGVPCRLAAHVGLAEPLPSRIAQRHVWWPISVRHAPIPC